MKAGMKAETKQRNKMKALTWKQLLNFAKNPNVVVKRNGYLITVVEIFWLPIKGTYNLKPVSEDTYEIV